MKTPQLERMFKKSLETIETAIKGGARLLPVERVNLTELYYEFAGQIERLWEDAVAMYERGSYSTAIFLSIVCIEESIKLEIALYQRGQPEEPLKKRKDPMFSHVKKHYAAVGQAALLNERIERLGNLEKLYEFLKKVENNQLEKYRQSCLYNDNIEGVPHIPFKAFNEFDAKYYIALAGEIVADRLGYDPKHYDYWCGILDAFEVKVGIVKNA